MDDTVWLGNYLVPRWLALLLVFGDPTLVAAIILIAIFAFLEKKFG